MSTNENLTVDEIMLAIQDAMTINHAEKLALLERMKKEGLSDAIRTELATLFEAECSQGREELDLCETLIAHLEADATEADADALPEIAGATQAFAVECKEIHRQAKNESNAIEDRHAATAQGDLAQSDSTEADAIRAMLRQK